MDINMDIKELTKEQQIIIDSAGGYGGIICNSMATQLFLQSEVFIRADDNDKIEVLKYLIMKEIETSNRSSVITRLAGRLHTAVRGILIKNIREAGGRI